MTNSIDYKTALRCAYLSNEVYKEFDEQLRFSSLPNTVPKLLENKSTDTQVAILENEATKNSYIVFRGSNADRDWLTNLDFAQWSAVTDAVLKEKELDYPEAYGKSNTGVKLHRGFIKAYLAIRSDIHTIVQGSSATRWIITGHSLGGALAKLCAVDLQYNFSDQTSTEVYTFGAPRIGNQAFAASYNRRVPKTYRFVNGNDIVCALPRRWQRYRHVNQRIRFQVPLSWDYIVGSLQDHRIDRYITKLKERRDS